MFTSERELFHDSMNTATDSIKKLKSEARGGEI